VNRNCTDLFLHYREIARLVWNLGFWPHPELREFESVGFYQKTVSRLFEAMVIRTLGYGNTIEDDFCPGKSMEFDVESTHPELQLLVAAEFPDRPGTIWGKPTLRVCAGTFQLRFLAFFDWDQLSVRDFRFVEVLIERLNDHPALTGRRALVEVDQCSFWLVDDEETPAAN